MKEVVYCRSEQLEIIHLRNRPFVYNEHSHVSVYIIGLVLHGKVTLKYNNQYTRYSSQGFFVVAPFQAHALLLPNDYDMLSICVNKDLLIIYKCNELLGVLSQTLSRFPADIDDTVLVEALETMYQRNIPQPSDNAILSNVLSLRCNPERDSGVQRMADEACYSLYHYIKVFKQHVGITPHKFQIQSRIRKAQRMIESGEMSTDVALKLGFYDQSHFIKCFKSIVGLTPSEYYKAVKQIR